MNHSVTKSSPSDSRIVPVNLQDRSYEILIGSRLLNQLPVQISAWADAVPHLRADSRTALLVSDENVASIYSETVARSFENGGWVAEFLTIPAGENSKSLSMTERIYDQLVDMRADRRTLVIALGGGVVGDLTGFVAATYNRGLPFVQVPTTLLAAVDSSVGGKVGINHAKGKNLIGAFHQPLGVVIDTVALNSLPERDYRSGLAEVVKYGVILDEEFFTYLEKNSEAINQRSPDVLATIIQRSCELKAKVVEEDEFERTGLRAILNYGHTFAHAYEALCGYGELMHGEAVSIGMIDASRLAEKLEMITPDTTERQETLLKQFGLPTALPTPVQFTKDDVLDRMKIDKKTLAGQLRFVLPDRLGHVEVVKDVEERAVREILQNLK